MVTVKIKKFLKEVFNLIGTLKLSFSTSFSVSFLFIVSGNLIIRIGVPSFGSDDRFTLEKLVLSKGDLKEPSVNDIGIMTTGQKMSPDSTFLSGR